MSKIRVIRMPEETWAQFTRGLLGLRGFTESTDGKFLALGSDLADAIEIVRDAPAEECTHPDAKPVSGPLPGKTEYYCDVCGDYYLEDDSEEEP